MGAAFWVVSRLQYTKGFVLLRDEENFKRECQKEVKVKCKVKSDPSAHYVVGNLEMTKCYQNSVIFQS